MGVERPTRQADAADNLAARARLFKALGHPTRLLILNLIYLRPRHGKELAEILHLKAATVSHHLTQLTEAGLLTAEIDTFFEHGRLKPIPAQLKNVRSFWKAL